MAKHRVEDKHWVEEIFEKCGALLKGHFVLSSWRHSGEYLDKSLILPDGEEMADIGWQMANEATVFNQRIEVVVGPAQGGIIIAHEVAKHLTDFYQEKVHSVFTEKNSDGTQFFKRPGFKKLVAGKSVLIVDDIFTTGQQIKSVAKEVEKTGGRILGVIVICERGEIDSEKIGYPLFSLWKTKIKDWSAKTCPLCIEGKIPIDPEIGRGKEYLAQLAKKPQ